MLLKRLVWVPFFLLSCADMVCVVGVPRASASAYPRSGECEIKLVYEDDVEERGGSVVRPASSWSAYRASAARTHGLGMENQNGIGRKGGNHHHQTDIEIELKSCSSASVSHFSKIYFELIFLLRVYLFILFH